MTKYIFHGGGVPPDDPHNEAFYSELLRDIPDNGTLLLVYFASREENYADNASILSSYCKTLARPKKIAVHVATSKNFLTEVSSSDAVLFRGGSTEKLLTILQKYSGLQELLNGKTVAGSSAGAYALSTFYATPLAKEVAKGLGISLVRVACHLNSPEMRPTTSSLEQLKETAKELPLLLLNDGEFTVIKS